MKLFLISLIITMLTGCSSLLKPKTVIKYREVKIRETHHWKIYEGNTLISRALGIAKGDCLLYIGKKKIILKDLTRNECYKEIWKSTEGRCPPWLEDNYRKNH